MLIDGIGIERRKGSRQGLGKGFCSARMPSMRPKHSDFIPIVQLSWTPIAGWELTVEEDMEVEGRVCADRSWDAVSARLRHTFQFE